MQTFRVYLLNADGKIVWGDWIQAAGDIDALAKAQALCDGDKPMVEVWQGARKVGAEPCHPAAIAPTSRPVAAQLAD